MKKTIDLFDKQYRLSISSIFCRGIAQPGSTSALGAEGREFESLCPDQIL